MRGAGWGGKGIWEREGQGGKGQPKQALWRVQGSRAHAQCIVALRDLTVTSLQVVLIFFWIC